MRYDVSFYQERFDYSSQIYPTYELGDILYINPSVTFSELTDNDVISYVPMEAIDERYGVISSIIAKFICADCKIQMCIFS